MKDELNLRYNFTYYMLGNAIPIRLLTAKSDGLKAGTQIPDTETGALKFDNEYLSKIEEGTDIEEIDETTFNKSCTTFCQKRLHCHK